MSVTCLRFSRLTFRTTLFKNPAMCNRRMKTRRRARKTCCNDRCCQCRIPMVFFFFFFIIGSSHFRFLPGSWGAWTSPSAPVRWWCRDTSPMPTTSATWSFGCLPSWFVFFLSPFECDWYMTKWNEPPVSQPGRTKQAGTSPAQWPLQQHHVLFPPVKPRPLAGESLRTSQCY